MRSSIPISQTLPSLEPRNSYRGVDDPPIRNPTKSTKARSGLDRTTVRFARLRSLVSIEDSNAPGVRRRLLYARRCPSGDHLTAAFQMNLFFASPRTFCGLSPLAVHHPNFVKMPLYGRDKGHACPIGETADPNAPSRSSRGTGPASRRSTCSRGRPFPMR